MNTTSSRKPIPGYEKYYLIDEEGRVWKTDGTELKPHLSGVPPAELLPSNSLRGSREWKTNKEDVQGACVNGDHVPRV